jgi:deoxyribodipyrimidine photo-lyase
MKSSIPGVRIRRGNDKHVNPEGEFVLYWMIAYRRALWNFSLQRAVEWAIELKKPLVILEALRSGYQWANDRLHRFIMDGMEDNLRHLKERSVLYYPYIELKPDAGKGLLAALSEKASVVITDDFPVFFIPRMVLSAAQKIPVMMEQVDSNGLLPMRAAEQVYKSAYAFRRFLQRHLPGHLPDTPKADPLKGIKLPRPPPLPEKILKGWPMADSRLLQGREKILAFLPLNHDVAILRQRGGFSEALRILQAFLKERISGYAEKRNEPEEDVTSGLSPYLHFGHISVHQIFHDLTEKEGWFSDRLSDKATGSRSGWWGMSEPAEAFLDELITWRELGFNMCWQRDDYDRYESLPDWALKTLKTHEEDERPYIYDLKAFEMGRTHDPLWNAAQMQLFREGRIHNYLRMLWGKKILHWSATPRKALRIMVELNNVYALDGRDPNSYSGIFWVLGRYDRPWGPERSIFGKVRYMSSKNTTKKIRIKNYLKIYAP